MKKIIYIVLTVSLITSIFSCSPQTIKEDLQTQQVCCGEDGDIPPPPPPPPGNGN